MQCIVCSEKATMRYKTLGNDPYCKDCADFAREQMKEKSICTCGNCIECGERKEEA